MEKLIKELFWIGYQNKVMVSYLPNSNAVTVAVEFNKDIFYKLDNRPEESLQKAINRVKEIAKEKSD